MIQAYTIDAPVIISGKDIFGRDASITFAPAEQTGWWWKLDNGDLIPITREMVRVKKRRICFCLDEKILLNIVEHITVLRMYGLDRIVISGATLWPPYLTAKELLDKLSPMRLLDYNLMWKPVPNRGFYMIGNRSSAVVGLEEGGIFIDVIIEYKGVGLMNRACNIECMQDVVSIIEAGARTQGWPLWLYHVARVAQYLKWSHFDKVVWVQEESDKKEVLSLWLDHRMLDILGMIGAMSLTGINVCACKFVSIRGGHKIDHKVLRQAFFKW